MLQQSVDSLFVCLSVFRILERERERENEWCYLWVREPSDRSARVFVCLCAPFYRRRAWLGVPGVRRVRGVRAGLWSKEEKVEGLGLTRVR